MPQPSQIQGQRNRNEIGLFAHESPQPRLNLAFARHSSISEVNMQGNAWNGGENSGSACLELGEAGQIVQGTIIASLLDIDTTLP